VFLLYLIAFVAGIVAGISPCILPVLPVILVASTTGPALVDEGSLTGATEIHRAQRRRAFAIIGGLIVSFSVTILFGSEVLSALHLPQDLLRDAGLAILGLVAVGLLIPALGGFIERPFARVGRRQATTNRGPFVLGLGLGALFVPCAGPVLTAITVVGANHRVGFTSVVLTADFALGAAVPLLAIALAGQRVTERVASFRSHADLARRIGGLVLLLMVLVLTFNWANGLQTAVPGYTNALQNSIERNSYARRQLAAVDATGEVPQSLSNCATGTGTTLEECGPAPAFKGVTKWLNTPGDGPLTVAALKGKVVIVDFWTYSCINCQRSLPHVEAWYSRYHADGLEVVGVHTPEFAFEHVVSNVVTASHQLGVDYPVAVDNDYKTWDAYDNQGWPSDYLIDSTGRVRSVDVGEGAYTVTESLIRKLLVAAHPGVRLPSPTGVPDRTPMNLLTRETYLGYKYELPNIANPSILPDKPSSYQFPSSLPQDYFALGGTWTAGPEDVTAGTAAQIELSFEADDVYLVLGGTGTLDVAAKGEPTKTITVSGLPRLYTLIQGAYQTSVVTLKASPGIQAYDFTFG